MKILKMLFKVLMGLFGFAWAALWFVLDVMATDEPDQYPNEHDTMDGLPPDFSRDIRQSMNPNNIFWN